MARTKRSAKLDSRSARLDELPAEQKHQEPLEPGRYLCYRRPKSGASGTWFARMNCADTPGRILQARLGTADDFMEADGQLTLTYKQACRKAEDWFKEQAGNIHFKVTGERLQKGPYTIDEAMTDYLQDAEQRGVKGLQIMRLTIKAHILPVLGPLEVSKLTKPKLNAWFHALAAAPRRRTGKPKAEGGEVQYLTPPATEDERRARKDSANRILTNLRAALNLAMKNGKVSCKPVWQDVERFKNVGAARVRFLNIDEQQRLVNVCPPGFRELVQAALFTGCRYGELCRLTVRDFDAKAGHLFVEKSKSGKPRHLTLTEEAVAWFQSHTAGKPSGARLLTRPNAKGKARKNMDDPSAWGPHDQKKAMRSACFSAGLEPLSFHELRHTYASGLVNAGIPLAFVAEQLGHVDTSMVEKHYGHLCPNAKADAIRKLSPVLDIARPSKVETLKLG